MNLRTTRQQYRRHIYRGWPCEMKQEDKLASVAGADVYTRREKEEGRRAESSLTTHPVYSLVSCRNTATVYLLVLLVAFVFSSSSSTKRPPIARTGPAGWARPPSFFLSWPSLKKIQIIFTSTKTTGGTSIELELSIWSWKEEASL